MKILIAIILIPVFGFAQISLEHTYDYTQTVSLVKIDTNEFAYWSTHNDTVSVFDLSHNKIKAIPLPAGTNNNVSLVSRSLFDSDSGIELIATPYVNSTPHSYIINEDGTVILDLPNSTANGVADTYEGAKLVMRSSGVGVTGETKVYSLPGVSPYHSLKPTSVGTHNIDHYTGFSYPNPTTDYLLIPYDLKQPCDITIYSIDGRFVDFQSIPDKKGLLKILTSELQSGEYVYHFSDGITPTGKFIVH